MKKLSKSWVSFFAFLEEKERERKNEQSIRFKERKMRIDICVEKVIDWPSVIFAAAEERTAQPPDLAR